MGDFGEASTSNVLVQEEQDDVISETEEFLKFKTDIERDEKEEEKKPVRAANKRKRNNEADIVLEDVISLFLTIIYPLSRCMKKFVVVGLHKNLECKPCVLLNNNGKSVVLGETAWFSLEKRMQLIDCYLFNRIFGKKTSFSLLDSDIEVDIIVLRGEQCVRIKDVTKHDVKVLLTLEEFSMLHSSSAAINNYIQQLHIVESCCKDYIFNTIEALPTSQILYSALDTSIMNRLPQEVESYRRMKTAERALEEVTKPHENLEGSELDPDDNKIEIEVLSHEEENA